MMNQVTFTASTFNATLTQTGLDSASLVEQTGSSAPSTYALNGIVADNGTIFCNGPMGSKISFAILPTDVHIIVTEAWFDDMDELVPLTAAQFTDAMDFLTDANFPKKDATT